MARFPRVLADTYSVDQLANRLDCGINKSRAVSQVARFNCSRPQLDGQADYRSVRLRARRACRCRDRGVVHPTVLSGADVVFAVGEGASQIHRTCAISTVPTSQPAANETTAIVTKPSTSMSARVTGAPCLPENEWPQIPRVCRRARARESGGMSFPRPRRERLPLHRRDRKRRSLARTDPAGRGKPASVREPVPRAPPVGHFQGDVFVEWSSLDRIPTIIVFDHPHCRCPFESSRRHYPSGEITPSAHAADRPSCAPAWRHGQGQATFKLLGCCAILTSLVVVATLPRRLRGKCLSSHQGK
jgi:hypothetical protein